MQGACSCQLFCSLSSTSMMMMMEDLKGLFDKFMPEFKRHAGRGPRKKGGASKGKGYSLPLTNLGFRVSSHCHRQTDMIKSTLLGASLIRSPAGTGAGGLRPKTPRLRPKGG